MGVFATVKDLTTCPVCGEKAEWQSKGLWLNYKGREIWIGDYGNLELDENMNGHIVCYCWSKTKEDIERYGPIKHITYWKIVKGKLIESDEDNYMTAEECSK
jgi:hypothetical protein